MTAPMVPTPLEGINGVRFEGCEYFLIRDGQIIENRVFYDTAKLLRRS